MFFPEKAITDADRSRWERRVSELGPHGDPRELGLAYLNLAHIYKQMGPFDDRHPFEASAEAAREALAFLRNTDDKRNLARALRASVVAFVTDADTESVGRLEEALTIAEELGDPEDIGWSHHAISTHASRTQNSEKKEIHLNKAIETWKASGRDMLVADALFQQALRDLVAPNQAEIYLDAAIHFERAGASRNAAVAFNLAALGGVEQGWDRERIREAARRQILNEQRSQDGWGLKGAKRLLRRYRRHNRGLKAKTLPRPTDR